MSVELAPSHQLGFHRPLTQLVKRTLTVANNNSQPVAYKVKTTAPKQYCVRPNSGRIEPGERVEVQVLLQPMKEEPPAEAKCRDKFLVQSAVITPDRETRTLPDLWAMVEAEAKSGKEGVIHEQKIRCAYLAPVEDSPEINGAGGAAMASTGSTRSNGAGSTTRVDALKSSAHTADADTSMDSMNGREDVSAVLAPETAAPLSSSSPTAAPSRSLDNSTTTSSTNTSAIPTTGSELKEAASNAAAGVSKAASSAAASLGITAPSASSSQTSNARSATDSKLQQELQDAKAEIQRLKDALAAKEKELSSGLRQRNVGSSGGSSTSDSSSVGGQTAVMTQDGVPLQMVGAIVLGVFVFTWLFF